MTPSTPSTKWHGSATARPALSQYLTAARQVVLDTGDYWDPSKDLWQEHVVADLLSGVPQLHIWVPEANGKTTLCALINLMHLVSTRNPRAVVAARNEKQAKQLFRQAEAMVQATPALDRRLDIRDGTNEIRLKGRRADVGLQVIPSDELSAHGAINTLVTIDEMHALPGLGLYRVLAGKMQKRAGAQLITISTAGEPDSEFEQMRTEHLTAGEKYEIERRGFRCVRAVGPQSVAWNWALDKDDDIYDLELVKAANPFSGITVDSLQAKFDLPGHSEQHWRTVVCNIPTRDMEERFLQEPEWDAAILDDWSDIPEGVSILLGADWGWRGDVTALVPLWMSDGLLCLGRSRILVPPRDGTDLTATMALAAIREIHARNPIEAIIHDEASTGGGVVMTGLLIEQFPRTEIVPVQPKDADAAAGYFLDQLRNGRLKHTGDPDLKRHLMNGLIVPKRDDPERFHIGRPKYNRDAPHQRPMREIDAAVAATLAVWGAVGREEQGDEPFLITL